MSQLVNELIKDGYLKTDAIIDAFSKINRVEFVSLEFERDAEKNIALPIGYGQTISQPLTVAFMFELLDPHAGQKVLDVGSGSGWTTALLTYLVGSEGRVVALERIEELKRLGETNVGKYSFLKQEIVEFHVADGTQGYPEKAPYDRILVSASSGEVPPALKSQLAVGGKMVIPITNSILYLERKSDREFYQEEFPGFYFVPLILGNA